MPRWVSLLRQKKALQAMEADLKEKVHWFGFFELVLSLAQAAIDIEKVLCDVFLAGLYWIHVASVCVGVERPVLP